MERKSLTITSALIFTALLITVGRLVYPEVTSIILNIFWFFLLSIVILFVVLGVLAIVGLKNEVGKLLETIMEGSFTVLDLIRTVKEVIRLFIEELKEILLNLSPLISYLVGVCVYLLVLYLYKFVSISYDVTFLTVALTILMILTVGILNLRNPQQVEKIDWSSRFARKIRDSFSDALEVVIFVFFLTMDSTNLFYVPANLNVPIRAEVLDYDLMVRSFHLFGNRITLTLIIVAIVSEIVRNLLKMVFTARRYYRDMYGPTGSFGDSEQAKYQKLKSSIRQSFNDSKDELVKFISFTTLLLLVFLLFPRLKILSMAVASLTALFLDLLVPYRLSLSKGNDLVSRVLAKVFKI